MRKLEIGKEYCLLTNRLKYIDGCFASRAKLIGIKSGRMGVIEPDGEVHHIEEAAIVKLPDGQTIFVPQTELVDLDSVPIKIGDIVVNKNEFFLSNDQRVWSGAQWKVKKITYDIEDGEINFKTGVLVCDSYEIGVFDKLFFLHQVSVPSKA